ncbi:MAG: hypothetical protein FJX72_18415 [Armatimonadetes bacterium]|nr:hypothetical protein [Armatimonadota bacterium]
MPLNDRKIISIILEQCSEIDERCKGYRDLLIEVISEILEYERGHRVSATNIQKKIDDKCNAAARFLASQRGQDAEAEELDS